MQKQQQQNAQLTKHDAFVYWSSSCAVCWWPIFRKLGTCSTTDALSARTLLTENIRESVQQILQHSQAEKKKKKKHTTKPLNSPNMIAFRLVVLFLSNVVVVRRSGSLAPAPQDCSRSEVLSPRTVLTKNICRCVQHILPTFSDNNAFSNNLHNTSIPAWLQQLHRLTPGDSDTWSLMMSLSRTLQVRP